MKRTSVPPPEDETLDAFCHGRIRVRQKARGYRFSVDAPLLAAAVETRSGEELCELGAGCGIVSLLVSLKPFGHITALEIQPTLADLARRNVRLNRLEKRITVLRADLRTYRPRKRFDVVFSNPPYIKKQQGFLSASAEKSVAKHEIKCDILGIMRAVARLLKAEGRAYFVFPARRRQDFERAAASAGLVPASIRLVHPRRGEPANLFLACCRLGAPGLKVRRPLVLFRADGEYTAAARRIFAGRFDGQSL
jgi:tRNA1Val (adenine37-N6)-methyltransferase